MSNPLSRALAAALTQLALLLGFLIAMVAPAMAADGVAVDLSPAIGALGEALISALVVLAAWGLRRLTAYLGLKEDDRTRAYLETAFLNGLQLALERALQAGLDASDVKVRSQLVAEAAGYVSRSVPDALKRFKLDGDGVRERLEARLGIVAPLPGQSTVLSQPIIG